MIAVGGQGSGGAPELPSSENLFSTLSYAVFAAPGAVVVAWIVWRLTVWCLYHARRILVVLFPGLGVEQGEVPRLFARSQSRALSHVFLFFIALPLVFVPLRYLADRLEGPQILVWHWLLVFGPIAVLAIWLVARVRRNRI